MALLFSASAIHTYDRKYVLNAVLNYEGANLSGKGRQVQWLPTWNVGGRWNIHREDFMEEQEHLLLASAC